MQKKEKPMRIRTINGAYDEIKKKDPDSCVSEYFIRELVASGKITGRKSGNRNYINMNDLERGL